MIGEFEAEERKYGDEMFIYAIMLDEEKEFADKKMKKEEERNEDGNETD